MMNHWVLKSLYKGNKKRIFYALLLLGMNLIAAFFLWTTERTEEMSKEIVSKEATAKANAQGDISLIQNRQIPIYCVKTDAPKVAISFDAAWGNEETAKLLEVLDKCNVKATFFVTGKWVESYPEDVKTIIEKGHDLGNHSEHHYDAKDISKEQMQEELLSVHEKVRSLTGIDMSLFRAPYGSYNDNLINTCLENHYYCIQWDVDSLDWKDYGVDSIVKTVLNHKHLGNGSIILMHNGSKYTADALEAVITGLQTKGYEIVKIADLIYKDDYQVDVEGRQSEKCEE